MRATVQYQVVRFILLALSIIGWVVFLVGFVKQQQVFKETLTNLFNTVAAPVWLFVVPPVMLFIFTILHIFKPGENSGHIFHAIIMFIDLFYKLGASVVIVMGLIVLKLPTIAENQSIRTENALLMMAGCVTSVFFYWISSIVWPLFLLRRPHRQYYEELIEN